MRMKITAKTIMIATLVISAGIVVIGGYEIFIVQPNLAYRYSPAARSGIKEELKSDGVVKPADEVELAFERSGKITAAPFKVGDQVNAGEVLAQLDNSDIAAQLAQARAGVLSAQAQYDSAQAAYEAQQAALAQLENGARPEDIEVSQSAVANAEKSLNDAKTNRDNVNTKADSDLNSLLVKTKDTLSDAYAKAFDAVNTKTAGMFTDSLTASPKLTFFINEASLSSRIESERAQANTTLVQLKSELDRLTIDQADVKTAISDYLTGLAHIKQLFTDLSEGLNYTVASSNLSAATVDTYKTSVNTALAALQTQDQAIIAQVATNQNLITTAESQITQAQNNLDLAQKQLTLKQAGATGEQIQQQQETVKQAQASISAQAAVISSAQASVLNYQAQYEKTLLKAPFDGVITRQDAKVGEIAAPNTSVIGLISQAKFKVETMISEDDIGHIQPGQLATVTLDSVGSDTKFPARVVTIDPGVEMVNGEPTYKTTLQFDEDSDLIKDGLTANIDIVVGENPDALTVPKTAVIINDNQEYVMVKTDNSRPEPRPVVTGLTGADTIEIISGLKAGEAVVTYGHNSEK